MTAGHRRIREEFARQVTAFEDPRYSFGRPDVLAWMAEHSPATPNDIVLEVAAGTGWFAQALAARVRTVIATDITVEMLAAGKRSAEASGLASILFQEADANQLSFLDDSFDRVVSRLSLHHFNNPTGPIGEMVRTCRPSGTITIIDMVAPEGPAGEMFNDLERRRDPTHTRALTPTELRNLMVGAGLRITHTAGFDNAIVVDRWLAQTETLSDVAEGIIAQLEREIAGGQPTGTRPRHGDEGLEFVHRWELVVAELDN